MNKRIRIFKSVLLILWVFLAMKPITGQVTIGAQKDPEPFSLLELVSENNKGLRLPQIATTAQRDAIFTNASGFKSNALAYGLQIFNMENNCTEYWNGNRWVSLCLGNANVVLIGNPSDYDPAALIPAAGTQSGSVYTPKDNPDCFVPNGQPYQVYLTTGSAYAALNVDEMTSAFSINFDANECSHSRIAVVRVVNNCTGAFRDFIFTQKGAECPAGMSNFTLQSNTTDICGDNGAAIVYVTNPQAGIDYIWEYGGVVVLHKGNYMEITRPGDYTVYAGAHGCSTPKPQKISIAQNNTASLSTPVVQATNSGVLCSGGDVILTATNVSTTVKWYKNGALYSGTQTNPLVLSGSSAAGEWFAVQQSGTCGSRMSNMVTLVDQTTGSTSLPTPIATVNGVSLTGSPVVCKGGTLALAVTNSYPAGTIFEWFDNGVSIGRGADPILYTVAPSKNSMVLSVQVSNSSGACPNTAISLPVNITFTAPAPTTINNGASTAAICGSAPAVLRALNASGASYEWYKNGVLIPSAATDTYSTTQEGVYTLRYKDGNGCWSPISTGITVIQSATISLNWQVEPSAKDVVGTQKSYKVLSSPAPDKYTWLSSNTAVATVTPIGDGSTVSISYISLGKTTITVTAENACGPVSLQTEIEVITGCTPITSVTITPSGTITKALDVSGNPKTPGDFSTNFAISSTNGSPATGYEWYVNGTQQLSENTASFTYNTPPTAGTYTIYAAALNSCTGSNLAKSASVTVNVTKDNAPDVSGNYRLDGKTCFDVKRSNDGGECMPLLSRTDDFAATKSYSYTFINSAAFTNLTFDVVDDNSLIVSKNTSGSTFTVTFREDINTVATGRNKVTALKFTVIARFTDNTSAAKQIALDVFVQDCSCGCTVKSSLAAGWLTFQCYNLGVPESTKQMTIEDQMKTASPTGTTTDNTIYGDLYQWGRKADGHEKRTSLRYPNNNDTNENGMVSQLDADGQVALPAAIGKFVKASNSDWRSPADGTLWYNNRKTANDPCPPGWRVPTQAEWGSIFKGGTTSGDPSIATGTVNKWTWTSTGTPGYKISPDGGTTYTLFLPAAGNRYFTNGQLLQAGTNGNYWSSTPSTTYGIQLRFTSGTGATVDPNFPLTRGYGFSIRCVEDR